MKQVSLRKVRAGCAAQGVAGPAGGGAPRTVGHRPGPSSEIRAAFSLSEEAGAASTVASPTRTCWTSCAGAEGWAVPAQKEIYWAWRAYLRQRFGKWPYALTAAGLSKSAGSGGKSLSRQEEERRQRAALLPRCEGRRRARQVPHPTDLPGLRGPAQEYARPTCWPPRRGARAHRPPRDRSGRGAAGPCWRCSRPRPWSWAMRPPAQRGGRDHRGTLVNRCSSWRNVLYQIGLEPVVHISPFSGRGPGPAPRQDPSPGKVTAPIRLLPAFSPRPGHTAQPDSGGGAGPSLGCPPKRGEVPAQVRRQLQDACGSWANALYQLGLHTEPPRAPAPQFKNRQSSII